MDDEVSMNDEAVTEAAAEEQAENWVEHEPDVTPNDPDIPTVTYQQERGGVAWCELYGKAKDEAGNLHLVKINLTNRGENAEASLRGLLEALAVAKNEFHMLPYMPTLPANPPAVAHQNVPAGVPAPTGQIAPPPPPTAVPGPSQTVPPQQAQGGTFQIVKVEVAPRADGKTEVKFYGQGHKFPDLKMVRTPEQIAAQFGNGWQKEHFQVVTSYNVALKVDWVPSTNLDQNQHPYKNISAINPG